MLSGRAIIRLVDSNPAHCANLRLSVGQKEVSKTPNESSMLSGRARLYLHLVGCYCNSSGNGDLWMVVVLLETENPSVIRNCRFESGWHGFG